MNSGRLHTSTFTPINTSNVFTCTNQEDTSFSSYHVTPRNASQIPPVSHEIQNNDESMIEANSETYREVIKQLSTQLQLAIVDNRQLHDRLNLIENDHNETYSVINQQNQDLQENNFNLQEKINNLFTEIQTTQQQLLEKDEKLKDLRNLESNSEKLNNMLEENNKLIAIIETQQQEIKLQKDVIQQYEKAFQEQNKNKDKTDVLRNEVEMYKKQCAQAQEQIVLWNSRYSALDQNYQMQYQDLYSKFNISQNELGEASQKLQTVQAELETQNKKNTQLQNMNNELKNELKSEVQKRQGNSKTKLLEQQIQDLQEQLTFKKNQINQLKEDLVEQQEISKLQHPRHSEPKSEGKSISTNNIIDFEELVHYKYEQRIKLLEDQIKQQQITPLPQQQSFEKNYYSRQSEITRLQLFSDKKDNYRNIYSFAKENVPELRSNYEFNNQAHNRCRQLPNKNDY